MDGGEDAYGWRQRGTPQLKRTHSQMQHPHRDYREAPPYLRLRSDSPSSPSSTTTTPSTAFHTPQSRGSGGTSNRDTFESPFRLHLPPTPNNSHPNSRYPGDGFDYRRPIMSTSSERNNDVSREEMAIIDLTGEDESNTPEAQAARETHLEAAPFVPASRPPRFARDIIDLSEDTPPRLQTENRSQPPAVPPQQQQDSPEVLFVSSRPRATPRPSPPLRREDARSSMEIDLTASDVDDIETWAAFELLADEVPHPSPVRPRRVPHRSRQADRLERLLSGPLPPRRHEPSPHRRSNHLARLLIRETLDYVNLPRRGGNGAGSRIADALDFELPGALDFNAVGFDLGLDRSNTSTPTYQAPSAAPDGFTRSPAEEDVLLCPNCAAELCSGEEDEKRQVWVLKGCGHVYCGTCAKNRSKPARGRKKTGKDKELQPLTALGRGLPFKQCAVSGCEVKATGKQAMVQLFL